MAKKDKESAMAVDADTITEDESTSLATTDSPQGSSRELEVSGMNDKDQMTALEDLLGCRPEEIEAIATGRLPFWPAIPGLMLAGVVAGVREVPTAFGIARLYTLNLTKPTMAQTLDGEIFELPAGENISVLERAVLKELAMREGQLVGLLCCGKKQGSGKFAYWDYKIVGVRRSADQIQAAAQMAMARLQTRALPPATAKG